MSIQNPKRKNYNIILRDLISHLQQLDNILYRSDGNNYNTMIPGIVHTILLSRYPTTRT